VAEKFQAYFFNKIFKTFNAHFYLSTYRTIRCNNTQLFFLNNQPDTLIIQIYFVINLYMFRASSLPIKQSQDGTAFHPDSAWKRSSKTCMQLTSAECTVENSWLWAEKVPETCRVLWHNKFG